MSVRGRFSLVGRDAQRKRAARQSEPSPDSNGAGSTYLSRASLMLADVLAYGIMTPGSIGELRASVAKSRRPAGRRVQLPAAATVRWRREEAREVMTISGWRWSSKEEGGRASERDGRNRAMLLARAGFLQRTSTLESLSGPLTGDGSSADEAMHGRPGPKARTRSGRVRRLAPFARSRPNRIRRSEANAGEPS